VLPKLVPPDFKKIEIKIMDALYKEYTIEEIHEYLPKRHINKVRQYVNSKKDNDAKKED